MVTIYTLNGISIYKRYLEDRKEFEFRLFEDNVNGHVMRFPDTQTIGRMLDGVWSHIQELVQKKLYNITTQVEVI